MIGSAIRYAVLFMGAGITMYPFLWMLSTSVKDRTDAIRGSLSLWPKEWLWSNYAEAFNAAPFGIYFFNTFFVAAVVTVCTMVTALMAGYAFGRLEFRGRGTLFAVLLATIMIPFEVALIPNFVIISSLGWYDTYAALIVPWCSSAFAVFLMRQAFKSLPRDYFDAARMDGCGHVRMAFQVGAPLVRPALIAVGLFAFLASYNSLLWPLVVTGDEHMRVVQVGLTVFATAEGAQVQLLMCASAIVMVPTVALYFAAQRTFIDSSLSSGMKA